MAAIAGPATLAEMFENARRDTFRLFSLVPDERDLRRPPSAGFRPILWHRGHIAAYEAYWLLQKLAGEPSRNPRFDQIFDPINTPREDASNLPALAEIDAYVNDTRRSALALIERGDGADPSGFFELVLQHELQHQETLLYLLHLLEPAAKRAPSDLLRADAAYKGVRQATLDVPGGTFRMGADGSAFAYDNERPAAVVDVAPFRIDRLPVTNGEYRRFVEAGGYRERGVWTEEGFAWVEEQAVGHPHSWIREGDSWMVRGLFENRPMVGEEPVWGVSWHEADAYARWAGRRLPTETEWEFAARGRESALYGWGDEAPARGLGNFDNPLGGPVAVGAFAGTVSATGCLDMTGNVWEWTATPFDGYQGFRADPYPEYSELWFDGDHRVARGGSWATRTPILRASFRNFFRRGFRIGFVGLRLAG